MHGVARNVGRAMDPSGQSAGLFQYFFFTLCGIFQKAGVIKSLDTFCRTPRL
jgi:hypothetical protein